MGIAISGVEKGFQLMITQHIIAKYTLHPKAGWGVQPAVCPLGGVPRTGVVQLSTYLHIDILYESIRRFISR